MRWTTLLVVFCACEVPSGVDASSSFDGGVDAGWRDPGYDIPPERWVDGGNSQAGGCYGRNLNRFIVQMGTTNTGDPWCATMHFKLADAGFTPLFPEFQSPEGFAIADARWALTCSELYLDTGELAPQYRPVHAFSGFLTLDGYYMGKPQLGHFAATIRLDDHVYYFPEGLISFSPTCPGP